ncbi:MAG TPA: sugar ABC transporter permease [Candidatus Treponema faecavium]|nr:sugar ABC transporter permease [Candidatus Treponema faecavium]
MKNTIAIKEHKLSTHQQDTIFAVLCILPVFIGLSFVVFAPIIQAIWISFHKYRISSSAPPVWNNFQNYIQMFQDGTALAYFTNTLIFIAGVVITQVILAFMIALLLNSNIPGQKALRAVFLIPWTIPSVVTALLWTWLLQPQYGVLNYIFHALGFQEELNKLWVQDPQLAMVSVIIACVWRQTPYMMIMLLAGLQSVPQDLIEAAKIDGASKVSIFKNVVLPSIRPVLDTSIVVAIINNSQMFAIIYNMTAGGPMINTTTVSVAAYKLAFINFDFGAGSAIGVLWLVFLSVFVFFYKKYSDKNLSSYI